MSDDARSSLPALTALLAHADVIDASARYGRQRVVAALRSSVAAARRELGTTPPKTPADAATVVAHALAALARDEQGALRHVINATGVLLHTNLGRAPLGDAALAQLQAAGGPTNLELELASGRRGGRERFAGDALTRLTGAEAALLVNNCAAALMLTLHAHALGAPVAISRGELVEIGGSFRIPEIVAASGARLMEVGTTNRTHLEDYREAVRAGARAILRVHPSNYRVEGFTTSPTEEELATLAQQAGIPFIHDVGSGLLPGAAEHLGKHVPALADEPRVDTAVARADLVVFSGDKLLGGPQVGIVLGRRELVAACARAPLARALRIDKLRLAALEATLRSHEREALHELPLFAMAATPSEELAVRAETIARRCGARSTPLEAVLGGGTVPGSRIASHGIAFDDDAEQMAARLRTGDPAVVGRIEDGRLLLDLRTVPPEQDETLVTALLRARPAGL